jgi:hypothetical protein
MQHQWPEAMLTAVHEAGHATISRVFGLWGGDAKIYDTPNGVATPINRTARIAPEYEPIFVLPTWKLGARAFCSKAKTKAAGLEI